MNSLGYEGKIYQRYMWIYITSPLLGGLVASLFVRFVHNPNLGLTFNKDNAFVSSDGPYSENGGGEEVELLDDSRNGSYEIDRNKVIEVV